MDSEQSWTIGQLATATGVTSRTIRYYTAEGLLPAPERHGTYARYGEEHMLRLRLIARLKGAYLPLSEIRMRLRRLSVEQLRSQLADKSVMVGGDTGQPEVVQVAPGSSSRPTIGYKPATAGNTSPRAQQRLGSSPEQATSQPGLQPGYASVLSQLVSQPSEERGMRDGVTRSEAWQRITLAPGVELHLREPVAPLAREQVAHLLQLARDLFLESPF